MREVRYCELVDPRGEEGDWRWKDGDGEEGDEPKNNWSS